MSVYIHVPYCRVRCGYCDFNTYTAQELGGGVSQRTYAQTVDAEVRLARGVLARADQTPSDIDTVFFGGGTPTLLPASDLAHMLAAVRTTWGLSPDAEVTTEANPDSVDRAYLATLKEAGFTRVSFGMQSAVPHVLSVLERTHQPANVPKVVRWAKELGLQVSLDLIYGTPGESLADWHQSLEAAIEMEPDHISAYALIVEEGTKLAGQVRRGEIADIDDDDHADKYELADDLLSQAGFDWYEVSNWSRGADRQCRHNMAYWRGANWWGFGPGAHSHVDGVRWWNVKHPAPYSTRLAAGESPGAGRELLSEQQRKVEDVLLRVRLKEGLSLDTLGPRARAHVANLIGRDLVEPKAALAGRLVLTRAGRLLADGVVREVLEQDGW